MRNSQWITFPTQYYSVLYSFWASLLHSFMWLTVSILSPHNQHLLFSLMQLVFVLFCAVFLLRFPLLCHGHIFLYTISQICHLKYPLFFFTFLFYSLHLRWYSLLLILTAVMSLSLLFLLVFLKSWNGCICAVVNADESSSSFLCISISFLVLSSIYPNSSLVHLMNGLEYLTRDTVHVLFWWDFCCRSFEKFFFFSRILFSPIFVWWCPIPIFPSSDVFLILSFCSFHCFSSHLNYYHYYYSFESFSH